MPAAPAIDTAARRCAAVLAAGGLLLPLAACTSGGDDAPQGDSGAARDVRAVSRDDVTDGGTLRWAVDAMPTTLNVFQPDATGATTRIAEAVLPALFTLDSRGRPQRNGDYLESAEVTGTEPRQTVVYTLAEDARWSDGRALSAADFRAQWKALGGGDSAYWTARNAGYDRIAKVAAGDTPRQVEVTFKKPYADWESLFTPLYPKSVMGSPDGFNEKARTRLPASGGPFAVKPFGKKDDRVTLVRNDAWWGDAAKLDRIALTVVPRGERGAALAAGKVDVAEVTPKLAERIDGVHTTDAKPRGKERADGKTAGKPRKGSRKKTGDLGTYDVRRALAPAYTQLALNGASGPLGDERVRRALARTLDRGALAEKALAGLGLPAQALGSHLRMRDQAGYQDNSAALGGRDLESAQALLADAGWESGAPATGDDPDAPVDAKEKGDEEGKNRDGDRAEQRADETKALDAGRAAAVRTKGGNPLALRFLVPDGPGTAPTRATAEQISDQLAEVGIRTRIERVEDESLFRDHIASGDFDLALYAWPASAFPATDAGPIFAKPVPAGNGSLTVRQNYTRVGTDRIDQLFAAAVGELDREERQDLLSRADSRIWAAAGSVPLYQRPQLVAVREDLANIGAYGFQTPRYQDIGRTE
ncbi:ABC transporter family substrate-binding protein [Streptomyces sp. DSM 42041]|uniref:ABC transporter family substrate-binding protein n=1 Tax=Streptomyces hazeniae TaxID=3075538 RepID=A0ABU2NLV7_9ACTN|nr:ABC transporter family substrate-binding protein [Streptomyces sp. DSM 42041]MDT0377967.1 ABC transporter family substrate-binding protein [Streptomyces sp. DSM 42041]